MFGALTHLVGIAVLAAPVPERAVIVRGAVVVLAPDCGGHVKVVRTDAGPKLRFTSEPFSLDASELTIRENGRITDVSIDKDGFLTAVTRPGKPAPGRAKQPPTVIRVTAVDSSAVIPVR